MKSFLLWTSFSGINTHFLWLYYLPFRFCGEDSTAFQQQQQFIEEKKNIFIMKLLNYFYHKVLVALHAAIINCNVHHAQVHSFFHYKLKRSQSRFIEIPARIKINCCTLEHEKFKQQ